MKSVRILKYVLALIGIGMLTGAFFIYRNTAAFTASAAKAEGTVIDLQRSRSSDTYRPVVRFATSSGQPIEFVSSSGSNPPSYARGERVEVLYHPDDPNAAKINGWFSLWGGATILGGMGLLFFAIGGGIIVAGNRKQRQTEYLRAHGSRIETQYQNVERNTALSVNGRHPFRILTQWQNPATAEVHVFASDDLWFDPTNHIKTKTITVFIERGNPKKYHVDLSFLPKLAE